VCDLLFDALSGCGGRVLFCASDAYHGKGCFVIRDVEYIGSSPKKLEKRVQGFEGSRVQGFVYSIEIFLDY
jgi:hypothetical protein